jgi:endo-1,4-beta-xylanase
MKKLLSFSAVILLSLLFTSCAEEEAAAPVAKLKGQGSNGGYFWTLYQEGGSASITFPNGGGNFQITYSGVQDVVGGKGWNPGSSTRVVNYNIGYLSGSYNFIGVYGWTTSPLIEYYVSEKGGISGSQSFGSVSSDGHNYNCSKFQRVNKPSIQGTKTFWQYFDNWGGAPTGSNQKVTMANHINNWRNKGGQGFGSHNYMVFGLEAFSGKSGTINATVW